MVFPIALLALPILGPPAVLILLSQLFFYLIELVFYLPLRLAAFVKSRRPEAALAKEMNAPELTLKLA